MREAKFFAGPFLSRERGAWPDLQDWMEQPVTRSIAESCLGQLRREHAPSAALRYGRRKLLAAIAERNLDGRDDGWATLASLSDVADVLLSAALVAAQDDVREQHGLLPTPDGSPAQLAVLAMGKLGGRELNFSSDVDLIFVHGPAQPQSDGPRPLDASTYSARVAQRIIALLAEVTAEGIVYRVDTRLRPFGRSGPITVSAAALEHYYEVHGRAWERYALMKARWVGPAPDWARSLSDRLKPFVYRRYLDFGAFASLRRIKADIAADVARTTGDLDIKRGAGGIREAEFIVQALQLVHGGSEPGLRSPSWRQALAAAVALDHLNADDGQVLESAYLFLRQLENRLQMWSDAQWHMVPEDGDIRVALARSFGYDDWSGLEGELAGHRERVDAMFSDVVGDPDDDAQPRSTPWQQADSPSALGQLTDVGIRDCEDIAARVKDLQASAMYSDAADARLQRIWPACLEALRRFDRPDEVARRVLSILDALLGRTNYLALLDERPVALEHLIRLAAASPWVVRQLVAMPGLLDELLDPRLLSEPPDRQQLDELVREGFDKASDDEARLDAIRQFQQGQMLRVAAAEISGALPLMRVSDHLSWIAEATLVQALEVSRQDMVARHGALPDDAGLAVIAYGKLGGIELNYGSDLDLVFLYRGSGESDGHRPLDIAQYAIRWAQRLIHWVSTQTGAGRAYEIDTRLRPSGRSGLLVTTIDAFARYQGEQAWTWEHQALCRARAVAGDPGLCSVFATVRAETLARQRDPDSLKNDVVDMRERLRREWLRTDDQVFDVKQSPGGLMDLEFLVQYLVLRQAPAFPAVATWSDNVRQLQAMTEVGVLSASEGEGLREAYLAIRSQLHATVLAGQPGQVAPVLLQDHAAFVRRCWKQTLS